MKQTLAAAGMGDKSKESRDSSIELLRIVGMFLIVAHHYVVNSGVTDHFDYSGVNGKMIFLQLWGMWGKTVINVFVMITGYFMCRSRPTVRKFAKIFIEAKMYQLAIYIIMLIAGYEIFSFKGLLKTLFAFICSINDGFISSFLMFYLFIPFYNLLIERMNEKQHRILVLLLLFMFTVASTFFFNSRVSHEVGWYMACYFLIAYIRIYGKAWTNNNKVCGAALLLAALLSYLSVLAVDFVGVKFGFTYAYWMFADSNYFLALAVGLFLFLFFKNLRLGCSRVINKIAASAFGVLCIHASSAAMRTFLWRDLLKVSEAYFFSLPALILHAVLSVIGVYAVCSVIDMLRIRWIEKPLLKQLDKYEWFR